MHTNTKNGYTQMQTHNYKYMNTNTHGAFHLCQETNTRRKKTNIQIHVEVHKNTNTNIFVYIHANRKWGKQTLLTKDPPLTRLGVVGWPGHLQTET